MTIRTLTEKFTSKTPVATYSKIFLASVIYVFGVQSFLNIGGTFSAGLGSIGQLLTFLVGDLKDYFSIIYIVLNIPLIIYFWKKVRKSFIYRTTFFLIAQAAVGALYLIPDVHESLTNLMNLATGVGSDADFAKEHGHVWAILVYALIGATFVGTAGVISWKNGGSTAGTDFVGFYYSTKKQQSIGAVLFKISLVVAVFSVSMTLIIDPKGMEARENWLILSVSTLGYIGIASTLMNILYPKYSKVKLQIHSEKCKEILEMLKEKKFPHSYNVANFKSGYTGKARTTITSVVLLMEVKPIIEKLYQIDPSVWVSETRVRRVFGQFTTAAVDE